MEPLALAAIAALAGGVYGFTGFGAALIAVPLYAQIVGPGHAIGLVAVTALGSAFTVLPGALREADRRACAFMLAPSLVAMPLGNAVLNVVDPVAIRWAMSLIVLGTLGLLVAGARIHRIPGPATWLGVGSLAGVFGGATGLNGPPLVMFQLAGRDGARRSRANTIMVLTLSSIALIPIMLLSGTIGGDVVVQGLLLAPAYGLAAYVGQRALTPGREGLYRGAAYTVIGAAGVAGLPIWG